MNRFSLFPNLGFRLHLSYHQVRSRNPLDPGQVTPGHRSPPLKPGGVSNQSDVLIFGLWEEYHTDLSRD